MRAPTLSDEQWALLGEYRLQKWDPSVTGGVEASRLLFEDGMMVRYLEERVALTGADELRTAASLFMKRYAFIPALGMLAATFWNRKLNLSPHNLILVDHINEKGLWLPRIFLKDESAPEFTSQSEKEEFFQSLFRGHLDIVISVLNETARLSKRILWENSAVYLFWVYENEAFVTSEELREKKERDFAYLLSEENRHVFGAYKENPLNRYYTDKVHRDGFDEKIRVRKTCCLSYRLENGERFRCKTCPLSCKEK
ncbi:siderophore-iron reductase FhuF [Rossellomorea aquimaris]|uniref:siderophore-iron reductase FhuF n=1 Tax=Rossellomorea aquimaris TaxID=189382 RepID=UPI001CD4E5D6|nr:siderophore-iron reductase FhuF [Rossellomorea aquimaris]MCA1055498.1 siderophore-iron reductase FhuF [Rossellomorea aquimaris]